MLFYGRRTAVASQYNGCLRFQRAAGSGQRCRLQAQSPHSHRTQPLSLPGRAALRQRLVRRPGRPASAPAGRACGRPARPG